MKEGIAPLTARAVVSAVLIVALVALASSSGAHAALMNAFEYSERIITQHPTAGVIVFVLLAALSAMLAFFSSAVLVAPAVFAWGPVLTALLLWLGWILGGVTAYTLARMLGRPVVQRLASATLLARLEQRLTQRTPFGVVLLIQLAFPSELPGYVLGLVRYPPGAYLAVLAIAELLYAIGTVLLGEGFVDRRIGLLLALGAAALVSAVTLSLVLRRRLGQPQ